MSIPQSIASLISSLCYVKDKGPVGINNSILQSILKFVRENFGRECAQYIQSCFDDYEEKDDEGRTIWYAHMDPGEALLDWMER